MSLHGKRKGVDLRRLLVRCLSCNQELQKESFDSHKARYHNGDDKVKYAFVTDSKQRKLSFTKPKTSLTDDSSLDTGSPSYVTVVGLELESRSASAGSGDTLQTGQESDTDTGLEDSGTLAITNTEAEEAESSEAMKAAEPPAALLCWNPRPRQQRQHTQINPRLSQTIPVYLPPFWKWKGTKSP